MIKFDVLNRFGGDVQFTAEIDCDENASRSLKLGLAVKWGLKNKANLSGSNLGGANLMDANLGDANLSGSNLGGANLMDANLMDANLWGANLRDANLWGANLGGANLWGANLRDANLWGANLGGANGLNHYIKCIQVETYSICYTSEVIQIGCERHSIQDWENFDDERIIQMDGKTALKFWRKYKDWIFQTIELAPAKPTREANNEG